MLYRGEKHVTKEVNKNFFKDVAFSVRGLLFQVIIISLITNFAGVLLTKNLKESVYGMIIEEADTLLGVIYLIVRDARNDCKVNMQKPKHSVKFVTLFNMLACLDLVQVLVEILFYIIEWGLVCDYYCSNIIWT